MAGTAVRGRLTWQVAAVEAVSDETASVRTVALSVPDWAGHVAGQHLDVRRDEIEIRGPIGGYFVWVGDDTTTPLLLVAGGSGVVPFRSVLRHRHNLGSQVPVRLLYSARSLPEVIYRSELDHADDGVAVSYALTRQQPPGWTGHAGRVDRRLLTETAWPAERDPLTFVCGPAPFVEAVASGLVELGYPAGGIRTERYGGAEAP